MPGRQRPAMHCVLELGTLYLHTSKVTYKGAAQPDLLTRRLRRLVHQLRAIIWIATSPRRVDQSLEGGACDGSCHVVVRDVAARILCIKIR
jgi:hypothetical protein